MQSISTMNLLLSIGWSLPVLLAAVVGIAVCALNMSRHSRPAVMGLAAFLILSLSAALGAIPWWYLLPSDLVRWFIPTMALLRSLATAAALILLAAALFVDRGASEYPAPGKK